MPVPHALQRRVKAWKAESDNGLLSDNPSSTSGCSDTAVADEVEGTFSSDSDRESDQNREEDQLSEPHPELADLSSISFGALAKAQRTLGKRKRLEGPPDASIHHGRSPDPITSRLPASQSAEALERRAGKHDHRDFSRSSKHAPAQLSSKKAVSRKREAVLTTKLDHRDPRFEPLSGPIEETKMKRNYAFLEEYRDDEMKQLKETIRRTKSTDEASQEALKRALLSMESKKKAQAAKDKQQEIIRTHRAREKDLIKHGKKPFYLKKSEQKKLALVERFKGLKGKQVERVMERKRKKKAGRERKDMPDMRRGADG